MNVLPLILALCLSACFDSDSNVITGSWSVPQSEILDGGPGKDGIPAVDSPRFYANAFELALNDDELIIAFRSGNEIRGYIHQVLDYHEIINDTVNALHVTISYCPLTGSSMVWESDAGFTDHSFGVSGLLYNSNLVLYDRATNSNWSQMLMQGINGQRINQFASQLASSEMSWGTWKKLYPHQPVLNFNSGFSRPYGRYPYGNYKNSGAIIFPTSNMSDARLFSKKRVLGIKILERFKAYPIASFSNQGISVIEESLNGTQLSIWGSNKYNFAVVFNRTLNDGSLLSFTALTEADFPAVVTDNQGNRWDVFGVALAGPRLGQVLNQPFSFIAYWFAWTAFYPDGEIYGVTR